MCGRPQPGTVQGARGGLRGEREWAGVTRPVGLLRIGGRYILSRDCTGEGRGRGDRTRHPLEHVPPPARVAGDNLQHEAKTGGEGQGQKRGSPPLVRARGAAKGWRVNLVIGDEPAQWGPRGELLAAAIRTALGKRAGARALFIGTRPASDVHFFTRLLAESDESVYSQVHAAPPSVAPFQVATWRRANPGLAYGFPALEVLKAEARLAKRDPAELATFRALRLNQGTSEVETQHLIDMVCGTDPALTERERRDSVAGRYQAMT